MESRDLSKKPEDSDFQQQRLRAWQPLLTPTWVILTFLVIGIIFIPIGAAILVASNSVSEVEYRYDHLGYDVAQGGCVTTSSPNNRTGCNLTLNITLTQDFTAPVYFYYKLTNFYQNHRRYVQSKSDTQLSGTEGSSLDTATCDPLENNGTYTYYPCGLIAYSIFNDTFGATVYRGNNPPLFLGNANSPTNTPTWQKDGIAWATDKSDKYVDHKYGGVVTVGPYGVTLPKVSDEDFMVWMRTAGLPTFRKLYRKINFDLKAGDSLSIVISNTYPVSAFNGQKAIVISTTSWMGGKNPFLGYAYIVVGSLCIFLAFVFLIKHSVSKRQLGDMNFFRPQ